MQTLALQSKLWRDFFSTMAESWKNMKDKLIFLRFLCLWIEIDLLYKWPPNSELLLNNVLLELIFTLNKNKIHTYIEMNTINKYINKNVI